MSDERDNMTIFDFLPADPLPDFRTTDFEEVVQIIGERVGLKFCKGEFINDYVDCYQEYVATKGNITVTMFLDEYWDGRDKFISLDIVEKGVSGGAGSPCDSIEEAIEYISRKIRLYA